jgi:hypothetical protein
MRYFVIFITLCFLTSCSPKFNQETPISTSEEQLMKDLIQGVFDDIWSVKNPDKLLDYHTSDFIILEHGEVWDNATITKWMEGKIEKGNLPKRVNRMEYISIDKYGPSIQAAYHNYAEFYQADTLIFKASWLESAIAVPTDKGWRLKMMHSTRMPRQ